MYNNLFSITVLCAHNYVVYHQVLKVCILIYLVFVLIYLFKVVVVLLVVSKAEPAAVVLLFYYCFIMWRHFALFLVASQIFFAFHIKFCCSEYYFFFFIFLRCYAENYNRVFFYIYIFT